jgi:hypothetical protein
MKRGAVVFLLLIMLVMISTTRVKAFGLSTPYIKDEVLNVNPGKTYEYGITLQNSDEQGYYVDITYSSTGEVASLKSTEYYVPSDTYNTTFYFELKIPEDARIGETYTLAYAAKPRVSGNGTVAMGVEIRRGITIIVTDEKANVVVQTKGEESEQIVSNSHIKSLGKYTLLMLTLILTVLIVQRLWRLSRRVSSKISGGRQIKYTISEAMNLDEVKTLLHNISDEEFEVSEIKNIFKDKLSELTTNDISHKMLDMSRRDVIRAIDNIKK